MNPNTFRKIQRLLNEEFFITSEPGNSILPLYKSNEKHLVTSIKWEDCKGHMNGWTKNVYGKAHKIAKEDKILKESKIKSTLANL